ncbi:hypothetical protein K440DRAFT_646675 [Wilcoxina mikolae CBS 423.85]|nr:hypothetical protein K440DRAFT_646675 [Wilcoxina mikolae CBS 423.85]
MCQLALRVILKKLTDELNQIGRHRQVRHPASDFAEVDWESLNFERIGEAYRKAVLATSELIEALYGIPRLVHGVHCTDSDESLQGTDHLGLCSPILPDKKKIMSVVVMSLLGFAWSQRANLLQVMSITTLGFYLFASRVPKRVIIVLQRLGLSCSYSPIVNILEIAEQGEIEKTRRRVRDEPFMLLYDNFNIYKKVQDERIHDKNIQHNNTIGAVVFLKTQQGGAWPQRLAQNQQSLFRSEPLSNLLDVHSGEQSKPYNLPPEQWWIGIEEIGHFTSHDVLALLFDSVRTYILCISEAMVCDTLWRFLSDYMTSTKRRGGVKLARFDIPDVYKLAAVRVDASPKKAFDLDEVSISENSQILEAIVQELNLDKLKLGLNFLVPVSGDQLPVQRLRSLKYYRTYDDADSINKLQWVMSISAIMNHIHVNSFEQMQERMATDNWRDIIVAAVKECIPPTIVHFNCKEKAPSEQDGLLENAVLLLQHGLIYRALGEAVAQGDSGRVVTQMQMLTVMFHGGRQSNYATECLEWSAVNLSGREGKWIEMDRFNEQLVNYIKAIYNPWGTPASDRFQREVIARLIILFGRVKLAMAKAVGATDYSSQHSEVSANADICCLVDRLNGENVVSVVSCTYRAKADGTRYLSSRQDVILWVL